MRRAKAAKPHNREGTWYLVRRVPKEFRELDKRGLVKISTNIPVAHDPRAVRATEVVRQLAAELEAYWRGLRDGQSAEARLRFEAAQQRARSLGLVYQTNKEIASSDDELIARLKLLIERNSIDDEQEVAAVMGGEERPALRISNLLEEYEKIEAQTLLPMSEGQKRKWRNPKKRAVANLKEVVGDLALVELRRTHSVKFREWWQGRILKEGLDIGTANKDFGHISKMLTAVDMTYTMNLQPVFSRLRLSGEEETQRAAFDAKFVQNVILADGALSTLNDEARRVLYVMADTGLRLSEAANLDEKTIFLDDPIPHVKILPNGRKLKTVHSIRAIPLVGCALAALRLHPTGFPRYRDNADSLSALANKVMRGKGMLPTEDHSVYSLRHTFEDRLTAVEAPEKLVASLMGHKWIRPKYGAGPTLEQKQSWLQRIAFKPPTHL